MSTFRCVVVAAVAVVALAGGAAGQEKAADTGNQAEIRALLTIADEAMTGKATSSLPIKWEQAHFIKSFGDKSYVPFSVTIDPAAFTAPTPIGLYVRVAKRGEQPPAAAPEASKDANKKKKNKKDEAAAGAQVDARHQYPFEDVFFFDVPAAVAGQPQVLRRAFAVAPGDYDVYVAIKEKPAAGATASPKIGVVKQELTVPSFNAEFTTSSLIIASKIEVLQAEIPTERQSENPYTFGAMKISPSADGKFTKADELPVIFWIYNAGLDPATKKPDIEIEYNFHQKTTDGEKFFNKTAPQPLNAKTLPEQFDLAAGHQLPGSLALPLQAFPEGDFRLEVKVNDKVTGKVLTRDATFSVAAQ